MERTLDVESCALVPAPQSGINPGGSSVSPSPLWRWSRFGSVMVRLFEHRASYGRLNWPLARFLPSIV